MKNRQSTSKTNYFTSGVCKLPANHLKCNLLMALNAKHIKTDSCSFQSYFMSLKNDSANITNLNRQARSSVVRRIRPYPNYIYMR